MKRIIKQSLFLLMIILAVFLCSCRAPMEKITPATIDILKIGKADCIVINTGNKIVMIDTGEEENLPQIHAFMQKRGYNTVDTLILTHFDKDHIGGTTDIISRYNVGTVIESSFTSDSRWYLSYHSLDIKPIKLKEDYSFTFDSCDFKIDIPKLEKYSTKQDNNSSLVISMKIGNSSLLFCGDAMELRVKELIDEDIGHYDFVKLPHHGGFLANYGEFLDMVKPSYGAITCSNKNPASNSTLEILKEYGTEVYQTKNGSITISLNGDEIQIEQ